MQLDSNEKIESLLIGDYKIIQSSALYKFTSDAIMLSRFCKAGAKTVLDLCGGSGIVGLHYYALNGADKVVEVEIQQELASMCERSVALNNLQDVFTVQNLNLKDFDGRHKFDLVTCNPPYQKAGSGKTPENKHLAICRAEVTCTLSDIVDAAKRSLKEGGRFCMCQRIDRLVETVTLFSQAGINPSRLTFVAGKLKDATKPYLFLIEGIYQRNKELEIGFITNTATDFRG